MFTFNRVEIFADFFYKEIVNVDNLNGGKRCWFRENIETSTYYIAGIRWELQRHTSWTLAEAYWWLSAFVLSWQLFIWLFADFIDWLNERFQIYSCRMVINVCITVAFGNYLCVKNQYEYILIPSLFCLYIIWRI